MQVFDSFEIGWQYAKKHGLGLSLLVFGIFALVCWLTYMCFPSDFWDMYLQVVKSGDVNKIDKLMPYIEEAQTKSWIVNMLQYLLYAGVLNVVISICTGETKGISLKYLSLPFSTYLNVISFICLMLLLLMVSMYCFMLPFIYFGIRLMFVVPIMLEEPRCRFMDSIRISWKMSKGHFFDLLGFCLLCMLLTLIGLLCLGVGSCFTTVICMFAYIAIYKNSKQVLES